MDDSEMLAEIVDHMTHAGITLDDMQSLLVSPHGLSAYFPHCRWADLNLLRLVMLGLGDRPAASLSRSMFRVTTCR